VSQLFAEGEKETFEIIDVDAIAHDVLDPLKMGQDSAYKKLVQTFGEEILNIPKTDDTEVNEKFPTIDRAKLGAIIFADRSKRNVLNGITHPLIIKIMIKAIVSQTFRVRSWKNKKTLVCVDIPLLFEGGIPMRSLFALKITVCCSPKLQLERLQQRNPDLSLKQCKDRIASQIAVETKMSMSDLVIRNDASLDDLTTEVRSIRRDIFMRVKAWNVGVDQLILCACVIIISNVVMKCMS